MVEFSTNYGFQKPDFNTSIWHDEVNGNFDLLDSILFAFTGLQNFVGTWSNSTVYLVGQRVFDDDEGTIWQCRVQHTSDASDTFEADRTANPTFWIQVVSVPIIRGAWANDTFYNIGEIAYDADEGVFGRATTTHTSSSSPDTMRDDAANWEFFFDLQAALLASGVGFTPAGNIEATDVQAAIEELDSETAAALSGLSDDISALDAAKISNSLLTTRGDIITRGASAPQRLALGTSGFNLKSDGTDVVWDYGAAEALIASGNLSGNLDLVLTSHSAFKSFKIKLHGAKSSTDAFLACRTSTDGGSNYDSGATDYDWKYIRLGIGLFDSVEDEGDNDIIMAGSVGGNSDEGCDGEIILWNPFVTGQHKRVSWDIVGRSSTGALFKWSGGGKRNSTADIDAIRIYFISNSFAAGTYSLIGMR